MNICYQGTKPSYTSLGSLCPLTQLGMALASVSSLSMERFLFSASPPFDKYVHTIHQNVSGTVNRSKIVCLLGCGRGSSGAVLALHAGSPAFNPQLHKSGIGLHACDPNTQEVEAGASRVQGHPWIHTQFQAQPRI